MYKKTLSFCLTLWLALCLTFSLAQSAQTQPNQTQPNQTQPAQTQTSLARSSLPVIKATSKKVAINDGGYLDKDAWTLSPKARPDIYTADRTRKTKWVTFYTDIDSIRVKLRPGTRFDFIILLNGTDSCYTQIASAIPPQGPSHKDVVKDDTIPFMLTDYNAIKVRAVVNDTDTLNLHFDVGSFSIHVIRKLNKVNKLQMGTLVLDHPDIGHTALTAHDMDGRFGWDLFEGRQVEIDYDNHLLIIRSALPRHVKGYAQCPLEFIHSYVCIKARLKKGNKEFSGDFMLDTGSDQAVIVDSVWAAQQDFPKDLKLIKSSVLKDPRGAKYETRVVLAPKMIIDRFELDSIPTLVLGSLNPARMEINFLGNDLLKRFNMILDLKNDRLYLKPNKLMGMRYRQQS